eukprot:8562709-Karenia_brevis.AAC.1
MQIAKEIQKELGDERVEIKGEEQQLGDSVEEPEVILESSPVGESQSNGKVERAIQSVQGQIRTIKDMVETEAKMKIGPGSSIWPWMIEYAADTIRTGVIGEDGLTAHERYKGRSAQMSIVAFGERVLYKPAKT